MTKRKQLLQSKSFPESLPRSLGLSKMRTAGCQRWKDPQKASPPCPLLYSRVAGGRQGAYDGVQQVRDGTTARSQVSSPSYDTSQLHSSTVLYWRSSKTANCEFKWSEQPGNCGTRCSALVQMLCNLLEEGLRRSCDKVPLSPAKPINNSQEIKIECG